MKLSDKHENVLWGMCLSDDYLIIYLGDQYMEN